MMMAMYEVVRVPSIAGSGVRAGVACSGRRNAVRSVRSVLRRLDHGRQLELLVVGIIALVSIVPLPVSEDLLVQLDHLVRLVTAATVTHLMITVRLRRSWLRRAIRRVLLHGARSLPTSMGVTLILRSLLIIIAGAQSIQ